MDTRQHSTGNIAAMKIMPVVCFALLVAVAGCQGEGVTRPPPTDNVNFFDAASNLSNVVFVREEDFGNSIPLVYGDANGGQSASYDSGQYDFHLEYFPGGATTPVRAVTFSETLSPDLDYTFVAIAPGGQPQVLKFTADDRPDNATASRVTIMHAHGGLGDLDVFFEPPGTDLTTAVPRGTISFASDALSFEVQPIPYRLYLTPAGDPSNVLFESSNQSYESVVANDFLVVSDPGELGLTDVFVSRVGTQIGQVGLRSSLRVIHGLGDRLDRDIYLDDTLSAPLFPAQPFGVVSEDIEVDSGSHSFIVTPVGNPGTEELSFTYVAASGLRHTILVSERSDGTITGQVLAEDKRSIAGQGTLRVLDGAGLFEVVNVYVTTPGTDITAIGPNIQMLPPGYSPRAAFPPGDYEITIEDEITKAILTGPTTVTLEDGGVYGILIVNGIGGSTVDLVLYDDFVP
jgi:hypothetical protein